MTNHKGTHMPNK